MFQKVGKTPKSRQKAKTAQNSPFLCGVTPLSLWCNPKGYPKLKTRGNTGVTPKINNMPSKSTKPVSGRVSNQAYIELIKMADREGMSLSQFVGYKLSQLTAPNQTIEGTISAIDRTLRGQPKIKPLNIKRETIPPQVLQPSPLNDYGRVGVDIPPDTSGYYKEEDVYKLELEEKFSVYGKWSNYLAIPKNQINRDGSIYFPINANNTDLLEEFATGNDAFPFLYKVVANSVPFIDEFQQQCVTFQGWDGIVFGTIDETGYASYKKWYYRYKDLFGHLKKVRIKMIG